MIKEGLGKAQKKKFLYCNEPRVRSKISSPDFQQCKRHVNPTSYVKVMASQSIGQLGPLAKVFIAPTKFGSSAKSDGAAKFGGN